MCVCAEPVGWAQVRRHTISYIELSRTIESTECLFCECQLFPFHFRSPVRGLPESDPGSRVAYYMNWRFRLQ